MRRAAAGLALVLALAAAGCGRDESASTRITSDTLTIYTGLPLRGERAAEGRAVLRGEKLALHEAAGRVGRYGIGLIALDDTDSATGEWSPGQVAANAREAAQNPTTIAYVGDLDSGATAVSLPITNEIGILHVSPLSDYTGLTRPADKGEPDKYYPSGRRNFARLVPDGGREADALARWVASLRVGAVALAYDGRQDGLGQGDELERALKERGVEVVDVVRVDPRDGPADVAGVARDLAREPVGAVIFAGASTAAAVALLRAVHARAAGLELFATSGVDAERLAARLGAAGARLHVTSPLAPAARRGAAARRMAARYRALFGTAPPPAALYGYEAMRTVLAAIRRAEPRGNDRRAVREAYFETSEADSVLGRYAIDAQGDTTSGALAGFGVRAGRLVLERLLGPGTR